MRLVITLIGLWFTTLAQALDTEQAEIDIEVISAGLDHPWGLDFLDGNRLLVTERSGQMRIIENGKPGPPIKGLPDIWTGGQGGLLDVMIYDGWVYFSYSEPGTIPLTNSTAVARGKLKNNELTGLEVIFQQKPKYVSRAHFGSRLAVTGDGYLFITLGDRYLPRDDAQTLDNHHGKMIRLWPDGRVPEDNPYVGKKDALPEIWSIGHRNIQGAAIHPVTGKLWIHEHGPKGGDEINIPEAGKNYGWPVITYGKEYSGGDIGVGTHKKGMEQPVYYWVPSIAPSGMAFYTGDKFPQWQGDLFIGSLKFQQLVRLELDGTKITAEERFLDKAVGERIRDVVQGPDGYLYLLTDTDDGKVIRLKPKS
ncbi:MAG: PQQ-dependent sugar dehydrogenase [Ketobacteraceae bacterium]|nr:PQQ-dependent sugar dehydrogenase [Ketobacteraceae bacterium]